MCVRVFVLRVRVRVYVRVRVRVHVRVHVLSVYVKLCAYRRRRAGSEGRAHCAGSRHTAGCRPLRRSEAECGPLCPPEQRQKNQTFLQAPRTRSCVCKSSCLVRIRIKQNSAET